MAVNTVKGYVELSADKPLPERGITGIESRVPVVVPGEQVAVLAEALGKILLAEALVHGGIAKVGLSYKSGAGIIVLLFSPVDRDLGFGQVRFLSYVFHHAYISHGSNLSLFSIKKDSPERRADT